MVDWLAVLRYSCITNPISHIMLKHLKNLIYSDEKYFAFQRFTDLCVFFVACYCGQSQRKVPCTPENAMVVYYSCGNPCGKQLSCGNHFCETPCHIGPCKPCSGLNVSKCPCGKRSLTQDELEKRTLCTQPVPTCGQMCERPLECGPPGMFNN